MNFKAGNDTLREVSLGYYFRNILIYTEISRGEVGLLFDLSSRGVMLEQIL